VNSVGAPVRSTAIAVELFVIHALGDAPSPRLIGWVSDHSSLPVGLALTLVAMLISGALLLLGARYIPPPARIHRSEPPERKPCALMRP
jgi:hypothetical protein